MCIVASGEWGPLRWVGADEGKNRLLKHQCRQLEVRIGNAPMGFFGTDKFRHDFHALIQEPNIVDTVLVWFDPEPSAP